jgi:hypothetical protein
MAPSLLTRQQENTLRIYAPFTSPDQQRPSNSFEKMVSHINVRQLEPDYRMAEAA